MKNVITACLLLLPVANPLRADDKTKADWTGQLIMLKEDEVPLYRDDPTGPVETDTLNPDWLYKVTKDKDQHLYVSFANKDGWLNKKQAVRVSDAPAFFTEQIKKHPNEAKYFGRRGQAYFYQNHLNIDLHPDEPLRGEIDKALADLDQAIKLDPDPLTWWHRRGLLHNFRKDFDRAVSDFNEVVKRAPDWSGAYNSLAMVWYAKRDYSQALVNFTKASQLEPANPSILVNMGSSHVYLKEYDQAIADFTKALDVNSEFAGAYCFRGDAYFKKRNYEKALADLTKAIELDGHYAHAWVLRAKVWRAKRKFDEAVSDLKKALELDSKYSWAQLGFALTYSKQQRFDLALNHFEKASDLNPNNDEVLREYALFRATCPHPGYRDGILAVKMASQALKLAGKSADWEHHAALAAAYAESKAWDKAVSEQQLALLDKSLDALDGVEMQARLSLYQKKQAYREK
jgi:tetratricopeptide (TPR) repeat protein